MVKRAVRQGWKPLRLDELGSVSRGRSRHRPRNDPALYGGPYPFVQTADVSGCDVYITSYSQTYSEAGLEQSRMWEPGTLCIVNAGENTGETGILTFQACFPDSIIAFVPDRKKCDVAFVNYSLRLMKASLRTVTKGATQDNLSMDKLLSFPLSVPPVEVQRRIGGVLTAYDDLVENNTKRIKILEEMSRSLYGGWFVNFRFPGHERTKFSNSKLGKIPEGWSHGVFTDMADVLSGGTPSTTTSTFWDGRIPWFTPRDVGTSYYVLDTDKHLTEEGVENCASEEYPGDTIFITARGTVGKLVLAGVPMAVNQSCYAIRGKPGYGQRFLYLALLAQVEYLKKNVGGATFDTIVTETFRRMSALIPPTHLVSKFEDLVASMFERVRLLNLQNDNLRATRDLLLPRLISGEIDVSSLPLEPAAS
jgi:type I restriction enzyme S subunit